MACFVLDYAYVYMYNGLVPRIAISHLEIHRSPAAVFVQVAPKVDKLFDVSFKVTCHNKCH